MIKQKKCLFSIQSWYSSPFILYDHKWFKIPNDFFFKLWKHDNGLTGDLENAEQGYM